MEKVRRFNQITVSTSTCKRLLAPHVPGAKLRGELKNTYKIKLRDAGYRLVYEVIDLRLVVLVIAIGKRDKNQVYQSAIKRSS